MSKKLYIKGPDGRIVAAQQAQYAYVDGNPVIVPAALKDGWSEASADDIAAQSAANAKRDAAAKKGG